MHVVDKEDFMLMNKEELEKIRGGSINGTLINAFVRGLNSFLDLGRSLGTALRMISAGSFCKL